MAQPSHQDNKARFVIIRASENSQDIVSSLSLKQRSILMCAAHGVKEIYYCDPSVGQLTSEEVVSNERAATLHYIQTIDDLLDQYGDQAELLFINENHFFAEEFITEADFLTEFKAVKDERGFYLVECGIVRDGQCEIVNDCEDVIICQEQFCIYRGAESKAEVEKFLFAWLGKKSDGFTSRHFNRPVSTFFSRYLSRTAMSPSQATCITALLGIAMVVVILMGYETSLIWGTVLFHLASVSDGIDGEIARVKYQRSAFGARLDTSIDMLVNVSYMGAFSYGYWLKYGEQFFYLGGAIFALGLSGVLLMSLFLSLGSKSSSFDVLAIVIRMRMNGKPRLTRMFNFWNNFFKRDSFAFMFAILAVMGLEQVIPVTLIIGVVVWNMAILLNAKHIMKYRPEIA